mmetsp:Transcript_13992/g.37799  ORF Transcript_13992/g.37799 Transcript_13992/m.37799 type:complete len:280 (-) Transcript_13992:1045-1884(-)
MEALNNRNHSVACRRVDSRSCGSHSHSSFLQRDALRPTLAMLQQCRHQVQGTHKCWGCQPACKGRCIRGGLEGDQQGGHGAAVSKQCSSTIRAQPSLFIHRHSQALQRRSEAIASGGSSRHCSIAAGHQGHTCSQPRHARASSSCPACCCCPRRSSACSRCAVSARAQRTWRGDAREGAGGSGACRGWSAGTWGAAGASLGGGGRSRCSLTVCHARQAPCGVPPGDLRRLCGVRRRSSWGCAARGMGAIGSCHCENCTSHGSALSSPRSAAVRHLQCLC